MTTAPGTNRLSLVFLTIFCMGMIIWGQLGCSRDRSSSPEQVLSVSSAADLPAKPTTDKADLPAKIVTDKSDPKIIKIKQDLKRAGLAPRPAKYWKVIEP